ncbi:MAG: FAD-dependent oxidoreductase, partial [Nitrospirota bacterium]|nr:FAD-dependent oxidoreductase [Nitrospirota bacterium]
MNRAVIELRQKFYDVAVVGGGIYGASVARDAAMRGLRVALVDQGDFGSETSANSHKIIHGGLRYLQHGDFKRMRESIRERSNLMRIAPHLVFPMPFLIPIFNNRGKGKSVFFAAMKLNDLVSFDRNQNLPSDKKIPNGRIISKAECLKLCPTLDCPELVGGAIYYDGQIYNPNRLILSFLQSAVLDGADVANYVRVTEFIVQNRKVQGLSVIDELTKESFEIKSDMVVNCTGPWNYSILNNLELGKDKLKPRLTKAMVLVTRSVTK